jgi:hypothetical protein
LKGFISLELESIEKNGILLNDDVIEIISSLKSEENPLGIDFFYFLEANRIDTVDESLTEC